MPTRLAPPMPLRRSAAAVAVSIRRIVSVSSIAAVMASLLSMGTAPPTFAAEPDETTISGTVTATDGTPVPGVSIRLYKTSTDVDYSIGATDQNGFFAYTSKHTGTYTLEFICGGGCTGSYETRWLGDVPTKAEASTFELQAGMTVGGLDAVLPYGATISGTVTTTDGQPIKGAFVRVYLPGPMVWTTVVGNATTNDRGEYTIKSLASGVYRAEVGHTNPIGIYHDQFWPGVPDPDSAGLIEVGQAAEVTNIDATLVRTSSVHGMVFDAEGSPFPWATVVVELLAYPGGTSSAPVVVGRKSTENSGFYWFNGLYEGTYALCYDPIWIAGSDCAPESEWLSDPFVVRAEEKLAPTTRLSGGPVQLIGPSVSGTAAVGSTLSATTTSTTTGATFAYSWLAGGKPLDGANGPTLQLEAGHLGAEISVRVTVAAPDRISRSQTTATPLRVAAGTLKASTPTFTGDTVVGETLTAVPGEWSEGAELSYEWVMYHNGRRTLSTEPTLGLTSEHLGAEGLALWVTGTKAGYTTTTRTVPIGHVVLGTAELSAVTITGTPTAGSTLTAAASSPTLGAQLQYRWHADGVPIPGAGLSRLELLDEHEGAMITASITAVATDYRPSEPRTAVVGPVAPYPWGETYRVSGSDRYATSVAVSQTQFAPGVDTVFIASGTDFPDALSGAGVAALRNGPLLLTPSADLPQVVIDEIRRLKPRTAIIFGGPGAVSAKVEQQLHELTGFHHVARFAGADRYATSVAISRMEFSPVAPPSVVYVANGSTFPDALSGAPLAGRERGPLLLSTASALPSSVEAELDQLNPGSIVILGGTGAVSDGVAQQLEMYTSGEVTRLAGADRYATSVAISEANFDAKGPVAYIANGANFPDALAGAPVAAIQGGPVLLTPAASLPTQVIEELQRLQPKRIVILGGTGSVSSAVRKQLDAFD